MFSFRKLSISFRYAFRGLHTVFVHEHSFRVHLLALFALVLVMSVLKVRTEDAAILILVTMIVLVLELANSVFERFIDIVEPRVGAQVRDMKDIMAGAVLIASFGAAIIGVIIFLPYIF